MKPIKTVYQNDFSVSDYKVYVCITKSHNYRNILMNLNRIIMTIVINIYQYANVLRSLTH